MPLRKQNFSKANDSKQKDTDVSTARASGNLNILFMMFGNHVSYIHYPLANKSLHLDENSYITVAFFSKDFTKKNPEARACKIDSGTKRGFV